MKNYFGCLLVLLILMTSYSFAVSYCGQTFGTTTGTTDTIDITSEDFDALMAESPMDYNLDDFKQMNPGLPDDFATADDINVDNTTEYLREYFSKNPFLPFFTFEDYKELVGWTPIDVTNYDAFQLRNLVGKYDTMGKRIADYTSEESMVDGNSFGSYDKGEFGEATIGSEEGLYLQFLSSIYSDPIETGGLYPVFSSKLVGIESLTESSGSSADLYQEISKSSEHYAQSVIDSGITLDKPYTPPIVNPIGAKSQKLILSSFQIIAPSQPPACEVSIFENQTSEGGVNTSSGKKEVKLYFAGAAGSNLALFTESSNESYDKYLSFKKGAFWNFDNGVNATVELAKSAVQGTYMAFKDLSWSKKLRESAKAEALKSEQFNQTVLTDLMTKRISEFSAIDPKLTELMKLDLERATVLGNMASSTLAPADLEVLAKNYSDLSVKFNTIVADPALQVSLKSKGYAIGISTQGLPGFDIRTVAGHPNKAPGIAVFSSLETKTGRTFTFDAIKIGLDEMIPIDGAKSISTTAADLGVFRTDMAGQNSDLFKDIFVKADEKRIAKAFEFGPVPDNLLNEIYLSKDFSDVLTSSLDVDEYKNLLLSNDDVLKELMYKGVSLNSKPFIVTGDPLIFDHYKQYLYDYLSDADAKDWFDAVVKRGKLVPSKASISDKAYLALIKSNPNLRAKFAQKASPSLKDFLIKADPNEIKLWFSGASDTQLRFLFSDPEIVNVLKKNSLLSRIEFIASADDYLLKALTNADDAIRAQAVKDLSNRMGSASVDMAGEGRMLRSLRWETLDQPLQAINVAKKRTYAGALIVDKFVKSSSRGIGPIAMERLKKLQNLGFKIDNIDTLTNIQKISGTTPVGNKFFGLTDLTELLKVELDDIARATTFFKANKSVLGAKAGYSIFMHGPSFIGGGKKLAAFTATSALKKVGVFFTWPVDIIVSAVTITKMVKCHDEKTLKLQVPFVKQNDLIYDVKSGILTNNFEFESNYNENIGAFQECMGGKFSFSWWVQNVLGTASIATNWFDPAGGEDASEYGLVKNRYFVYTSKPGVTVELLDPSTDIISNKNEKDKSLSFGGERKFKVSGENIKDVNFYVFNAFKVTSPVTAFLISNKQYLNQQVTGGSLPAENYGISKENMVNYTDIDTDLKNRTLPGLLEKGGSMNGRVDSSLIGTNEVALISMGFMTPSNMISLEKSTVVNTGSDFKQVKIALNQMNTTYASVDDWYAKTKQALGLENLSVGEIADKSIILFRPENKLTAYAVACGKSAEFDKCAEVRALKSICTDLTCVSGSCEVTCNINNDIINKINVNFLDKGDYLFQILGANSSNWPITLQNIKNK